MSFLFYGRRGLSESLVYTVFTHPASHFLFRGRVGLGQDKGNGIMHGKAKIDCHPAALSLSLPLCLPVQLLLLNSLIHSLSLSSLRPWPLPYQTSLSFWSLSTTVKLLVLVAFQGSLCQVFFYIPVNHFSATPTTDILIIFTSC